MRRIRLELALPALLAATLGLVVLLPAAARDQGGSTYGGTLTVGLTHGYPDSLDPTTNVSFSSVVIFRAIALRLYDFDAKGNVYPSSPPRFRRSRRTS